MTVAKTILKKEIGLFVENNIDSYRRGEDIDFSEMVNVFSKNGGFFILNGKGNQIEGYLDLSDIRKVKRLAEKEEGIWSKKINKIKKKLNFRDDYVFSTESVEGVLKKFGIENTFFPVLMSVNEKKFLIGRISRDILRKKLKEVYKGLDILNL